MGKGLNPKLWELRSGTKIRCNLSQLKNEILEFINIDGVYARWKRGEGIIIMGHANQRVSEYGDIVE